jgi:large subunit ribosomal protein L3
MKLGLVGRKVGMTRIFTDDGDTIPVTVVDVSNNRVSQIKTPETDGYAAVQVVFGKRRTSRVRKPAAGHFAKAAVEAGRVLREFPVAPEALAGMKVGATIAATIFEVGQYVDVTGVSQGKGFSGVIKRHNFSSNRASHGNSVSHNKPGSIGMSLEIVRIDAERNLLLIRGAIPGSRGGDVMVRPAVRARRAAVVKQGGKAAAAK